MVLAVEGLEKVGEFRKNQGRLPLREIPGTRFLVHGKGKEGFRECKQFQKQLGDVMDALETLHP